MYKYETNNTYFTVQKKLLFAVILPLKLKLWFPLVGFSVLQLMQCKISLFINICHFRSITSTNHVTEIGQSCRCYYLSGQEECLWKDRDVSGKEAHCVLVHLNSVSLINLVLVIVFHITIVSGYRGQLKRLCVCWLVLLQCHRWGNIVISLFPCTVLKKELC